MVWVGIDAGKSSHHAVAVDADGRRLWSVKVGNSQRPLEELVARAARTGAEVRWAVDLVSPVASLLIAVLLISGHNVVYVPGRTVHGMAGVFRGEGKSDAKDAAIIADVARMRRDLTTITGNDELVVELTRLTSHRTDLMAEWVRGINRRRELLGSIFPGLEAAFDYSTRSALILVTEFCTPTEIRAAGHDGLTEYLAENGAWRKGVDAMATTALQAAAEQTVALPGEATTALLAKRLARKLLDLGREIKDTDKLITSRFREHPQAHIMESLPGMSPILGAEFLVASAVTPRLVSTTRAVSSYAGLVPVPKDFGRVTGNWRRSKRYNRTLRRVFYMAAFPASAPTAHPGPSTSANAPRTAPHPGHARPGQTPRRRPVGPAARQPHLQPSAADHGRCGLTRSLRFLPPAPARTDGTKGGPNQRGSSGDLCFPRPCIDSRQRPRRRT